MRFDGSAALWTLGTRVHDLGVRDHDLQGICLACVRERVVRDEEVIETEPVGDEPTDVKLPRTDQLEEGRGGVAVDESTGPRGAGQPASRAHPRLQPARRI